LTIILRLKSGEGLDGKSFRFTPDELGKPVIISWKDDGETTPQSGFSLTNTLLLEFGKIEDGKISGKIYWSGTDESKSFAIGTFTAVLK
jgi:hypothetical protein